MIKAIQVIPKDHAYKDGQQASAAITLKTVHRDEAYRPGDLLEDLEYWVSNRSELHGSVLIEEGHITSGFDTASPCVIPCGTEVVDCTDKIITPGFIDTHRHGWQTVFKMMGSNTTLADYALQYSAGVAAPLFTPEDLYISQLTGIYEALAAGVTTILDHAHHTWTPDFSAADLNASVDSEARVFFAYAFQNSSAEFGIPGQTAQWKELASAMSSNLTELVVAYDDFTGHSTGADTLAVMDLITQKNVSLLTTHHVEGPWVSFLLATSNGGSVLGRKDLGVIAPGAKADIVVWQGRSPAMLGWTDPVTAIILHASVGDLEHVLVDGEFKKRGGRLVVDGYADVQDRFLASAKRIQGILRETSLPSQEGSFLSGYPYGYVLQLDAQRGDGTGYGSSFI
ncbi:hypothetical protein VMCG_09285 [Cytospora schulzeri]|uniref:Amidohydrolase-related domain-containing protein n=1 Tax=Cytospora schulzeri TaxID=448051 RepID=A0A423VMD3_9PEZI|nr:hypothetical protein VMCG_09285 [Valsa malicola]